jgi:cell migration-inducing and hyaluronan-binding protein
MSLQQKFASSGSFNRIVIPAFLISFVLLTSTLWSATRPASRPTAITCSNSESLPTGGDGSTDVQVVGPGVCFVNAGAYHYHNFNIYDGGTLQFVDNGNTDLWAANILIENNSSLIAGSTSAPYGANGILTIHLWGRAQAVGTGHGDGGIGITCLSDNVNQCGVPTPLWDSNPITGLNPTSCVHAKDVQGFNQNLPGNVDDCFYAYMPIDYDDGGNPPGYFGYKVLGVSYGGTLNLYGLKGATYSQLTPADSATSWARLAQSVTTGATTLVLDRVVDWTANDQIVLTSTDELPAHTEQFTIQSAGSANGQTTLTLTSAVQYDHNGQTFDLKRVPSDIGPDQDPNVTCSTGQTRCVETRAAVGLLTRSIRIMSGGDHDNEGFPNATQDCQNANNCYYFGGHTLIRQGFLSVQIQGVEFYQLGEGGRIMHYPVHFHMARQTPANTYIADSTVYDSMNRWFTIHATEGVTLARNVGFLSIGHGFYLEDGSETGNRFYANLGVLARAAIQNPQNLRYVPGIFAAAHQNSGNDEVPFHTDFDHPTTFWIMNGDNDFEYNLAAGAGTCGMCYWLLPSTNSGNSRYEYWDSYAGEQQYRVGAGGIDNLAQAGITPLYKFVGNACSTAQNSFSTIGNSTPCTLSPTLGDAGYIQPIINSLSPDFPEDPTTQAFSPQADAYYPKVAQSGFREATQCPSSGSCATVNPCAYDSNSEQAPSNCMITDIDHYTTSFNWAQLNYGAIWLRSQWYLFTNSAVTNVIGGGLTFISGGGYTGSDHIPGYWALAHKNVFIGNAQPDNWFASPAGPFNPNTGLTCDAGLPASVCSSVAQGVAIPIDNFGIGQRMLSIYDGPAYQSANAYLDITKTILKGCTQGNGAGGGDCTGWMFWRSLGVPLDPTAQSGSQCYMPNAAIAWKQSNGFYYPPAFHSDKLFFDNVDIRHYVIEPLFQPGTFTTDARKALARYCIYSSDMFSTFTDIDRQTELSDDDGSLTGLLGPQNPQTKLFDPAISINKDKFFDVPAETVECASDIRHVMLQGTKCPYKSSNLKVDYSDLCGTAKTSPYEYVTSVVFPNCATNSNCTFSQGNWGVTCQDQTCYGVPLYREDTNPGDPLPAQIRMMADATYQRSNLTANHGLFYIDTTVSQSTQSTYANPNVFVGGQTYYVFQLFAKPDTSITYQLYVGTDFDPSTQLAPVRVNQLNNPPTFTTGAWGSYPCPQGGCYDKNTGILTVPLDMSLFSDFQSNYDAEKANECAPATFCTWNPSKKVCGCNPNQTSASMDECENACANWSTKDVDCPSGGCFGFAIQLPDDFVAGSPKVGPPNVACYPNNTDWNLQFSQPLRNPGRCAYSTLPPPASFCGNYSLGQQ